MINISNFSIVNQVLALSETGCLDDLTIVCSDGTVSSNSFVLTAMFPVLRNVLETPLQYEERPVILVPDLAKCDLETILQNVFQNTLLFGVSKDLELLMKPGGVSRVKFISDTRSYSDIDTNVKVNVQQHIPCEYCGKTCNNRRELQVILELKTMKSDC